MANGQTTTALAGTKPVDQAVRKLLWIMSHLPQRDQEALVKVAEALAGRA